MIPADPCPELTEFSLGLYAEEPKAMLYHYTSFAGLMGIVQEKALWASEIRYLNDSQELQHFGRLVHSLVIRALEATPHQQSADILGQFDQWLRERLALGPMIFVGSLTENGNLLSQWRGYCGHGQGVSLGFAPDRVVLAARDRAFTIGRCIYEGGRQTQLVDDFLKILLAAANSRGPDGALPATQSFHGFFQELEPQIFRIAPLFKSGAFSEESEWRAVSLPVLNFVQPPIRYRPGATMLIPFIDMPLPTDNGRLVLPKVYIGPTSTPGLSVHSVSMYLAKYAAAPAPREVSSCGISHRV